MCRSVMAPWDRRPGRPWPPRTPLPQPAIPLSARRCARGTGPPDGPRCAPSTVVGLPFAAAAEAYSPRAPGDGVGGAAVAQPPHALDSGPGKGPSACGPLMCANASSPPPPPLRYALALCWGAGTVTLLT